VKSTGPRLLPIKSLSHSWAISQNSIMSQTVDTTLAKRTATQFVWGAAFLKVVRQVRGSTEDARGPHSGKR